MKSLLRADSRDELLRRVALLDPTAVPRFGKFTATGMLAHLVQSLRMTSGDLEIPSDRAPWLLRRPPLKHLLIYVLPFPRGMSTFTELLARPVTKPASTDGDAEWAALQDAFQESLAVVGAKDIGGGWPDHGAFGPLSGRQWGILQYRHLDHHLRQFHV